MPESGKFTAARISRATLARLKKVWRSDPEFRAGPPFWTLTDLLDRAVTEWLDGRAAAREKRKARGAA